MHRTCFILLSVLLMSGSAVRSAQCAPVIEEEWEVRLTEMAQAALPGDTVLIPGDTLLISKTLVLEDISGVTLVFQPGSLILLDNVYRDIIKLVGCSNVTVYGGSFRHVEPLDHYDCHGGVVVLEDCSGVTVDNCRIMGCGAVGFRIVDSRNIEIVHCIIEDNSFSAFYLRSFNNLDISHCVIRDNGRLFYSSGQEDQTDLRMENNLIRDNSGFLYDRSIEPGLREEGPQ